MTLLTRALQLRSLKQWVFIAFFLVNVPIGFMLYKSSMVLENQLQQSYRLAQISLELSQQNNSLERLAEDIVRAATQFRILKKPEIQERLTEQVERFNNHLSIQMFITEQNQKQQKFQDLFAAIQKDPFDETINELPQLTRELAEESFNKAGIELANLQEQARITRENLWLQTAFLAVATFLFMLFFSSAITRPITKLTSRIEAIGRRENLPKNPISGPKEIVQLNNQLLWLDQHLLQLERLKREFIQHISHELKTPLTTLREGADLLAEEVPGTLNERQHHVVSLLQSSSINLQKLIEQLLDYNKLQQSHTLKIQHVDIRSIIMKAISPLQLLICEKSITLTLPKTSLVVQLDPDMLHRVLGNLVSNAIYYTDKDGHVTIDAYASEKQLIIDVENNGSEISATDAENIFEPFYQGKKKRTGPLKGSGIGLSIAMEASKAMHGELNLRTNREGEIVFRLELPLKPV
jgi:two-component system sensor histidine kinase GlrK